MERVNAAPTFTDLALVDLGRPAATAFFARLDATVPFARLAASVAGIFDDADPGAGGAPHWPVVTMIRVLFLQKCFGLSDPAAEEMLRDRISFRRFVGLSLDDETPDHSTTSVFRKRLRDAGHGSTLFDEALAVLRERGLVVNTGTLIDATILEAPLGGTRADGSGSADPAATRTAKGGRPYHGYRGHIATDRQGVITDYVFDTASVSEHAHFDHLARHEPNVVFADSGCRSKRRVEEMRARGVTPALCHRRVRGQRELTPEQRRLNRLIAPVRDGRAPVRVVQAAAEQPPRALPRRPAKRLRLRDDVGRVQLLPRHRHLRGGRRVMSGGIPCADRTEQRPGGRRSTHVRPQRGHRQDVFDSPTEHEVVNQRPQLGFCQRACGKRDPRSAGHRRGSGRVGAAPVFQTRARRGRQAGCRSRSGPRSRWRKGTANLFLAFEPLADWCHYEVTERRTRLDFARFVRDLLDGRSRYVKRVVLITDDLNAHRVASLYAAFPPAEARIRLADLTR